MNNGLTYYNKIPVFHKECIFINNSSTSSSLEATFSTIKIQNPVSYLGRQASLTTLVTNNLSFLLQPFLAPLPILSQHFFVVLLINFNHQLSWTLTQIFFIFGGKTVTQYWSRKKDNIPPEIFKRSLYLKNTENTEEEEGPAMGY